MKYFIGVDIGTTGIRAGVYNLEFELSGTGRGRSVLKRDAPGEVYQDPEEIYSETAKAVREAVESSDVNPGDIVSISLGGQMAGIMGIDDEWNPLTPYDSWLDTRCSSELEYMVKTAHNLIIEKTGIVPSFNHGPKIIWWKNRRPEIFKKISSFIQPSVYVAGRLGGLKGKDAFVDWTYIHFSGFADNPALEWDAGLLSAFGVPRKKLPEIISPVKVVGFTQSGAAGLFGLPTGIPIAAGCGDAASCFLGAGVIDEGTAVDIAGTASVFAMTGGKMVHDYEGMVYSARSVKEGLWYCMSYINGGGMNLEWFKKSFASGTSFDRLNSEAEKISPGSDGLVFIPHLEGRAYPNNSNMRGSWSGFTRKHSLPHFYRSILEATGYEYALYRKRILGLTGGGGSCEVRIVGGGAKSAVWNQIKADILGLVCSTINREDIGILGQALVAAEASGSISDMAGTVAGIVGVKDRFYPNMKAHEVYRGCIEKYRALLEREAG